MIQMVISPIFVSFSSFWCLYSFQLFYSITTTTAATKNGTIKMLNAYMLSISSGYYCSCWLRERNGGSWTQYFFLLVFLVFDRLSDLLNFNRKQKSQNIYMYILLLPMGNGLRVNKCCMYAEISIYIIKYNKTVKKMKMIVNDQFITIICIQFSLSNKVFEVQLVNFDVKKRQKMNTQNSISITTT